MRVCSREMAGVNQRDYRSLSRVDSSIRSSTKIIRVDEPRVESSTPEPTPPPVTTTEKHRSKKRELPAIPTDSGEGISNKIQALQSIPDLTPVTKTGPVARLRPVQNLITAVNTMRNSVEESRTSSTSGVISKILEPLREASKNTITPDPTNQKIIELEKTIKSLEESKHDTLVEMWKLRDEMEKIRQQTKIPTPAQNVDIPDKKIQETQIQERIDGFIGEVKNIVDESIKDSSKALTDTINTLDTKTHERESIIENAVEVLAKQLTTVEKKEAVVETRVEVLEGRMNGEMMRLHGEIENAIERNENTNKDLQSNVKTLEKQLDDTVKQIDDTKTYLESSQTKTFSILETEITKLKTQQAVLEKEQSAKSTDLKTTPVESVKIDDTKLKQEITEDVSSKIQSAMLKVQTERAEREREIVKEQREIRDLISKTELKLMTEIKKAPSASASVSTSKIDNIVEKEDTRLQERIRALESELKILREKVGDVHMERRSRSNPRSRPHSTRELDSHRLAEFPLFVAELFNEQVIVGDSGLQPLIVPKHWEIVTDTDKGFNSDGIYHVPFPGCYDVNVVFKTISTSVTAQIYVEHIGTDGKIIKSYALDQGALVNESTGTVKLLNMNGGEGIRLRIQTRFNMALVERQIIEDVSADGTKHEHHVVFNMVQITYSPVRGFCEC